MKIGKVKIKKGGVQNTMRTVVKCSEHPDKDVWARGLCKNCYDKWLKANNPEYVQRQSENCKNWCKEHAVRLRATKKKWVAKQDKTYLWAGSLRRNYGITPDDYFALLKSQNGVCNICNNAPKSGKRLAIDHCHKTGRIRGLLCFRCNFGLSFFSEDANTLRRAANHCKV